MNPPVDNPLDYAAPENQRPPRFAVHRAGFILLAVLGILAAAGVILNRIRGPSPDQSVPSGPIRVVPISPQAPPTPPPRA